jgi:chromosome segregation ATPase
MVLIEGGLHGDSSVTPDFVEWREEWSPSFTLRPTVRPGASYSSVSRSLRASALTGQSGRVAVLERELEEARTELSSLRLARASEREESAARVESMQSTLHHNSVAVANLRRDLEIQRGNVSTLRTMNDFIREQLEISEAAKDHMEETLTETQGQLETEQVERTRVQDELDSLRSYTQALVDPSTGRPHDIVALRRALDESEVALTSARTSIGAMRVQISVLQGDNGVLQTEVDLVHDALESNASWLN